MAADSKLSHMEWLVHNRSENQKLTLDLLFLYKTHRPQFLLSPPKRSIAQCFTAASFSLWRAVFLSDVENIADIQVKDAESFLDNLVLHNSVTYSNDQNAKNFTFRYYVQAARDSLKAAKTYKDFEFGMELKSSFRMTAYEWWDANHQDLNRAIVALKARLEADAQNMT